MSLIPNQNSMSNLSLKKNDSYSNTLKNKLFFLQILIWIIFFLMISLIFSWLQFIILNLFELAEYGRAFWTTVVMRNNFVTLLTYKNVSAFPELGCGSELQKRLVTKPWIKLLCVIKK